jgi:hypothetical protein
VPRHRLTASVLLSAAATLAGMAGFPAPARAAAQNISIISAGPTAGHPDLLTVVAQDANNVQLLSMTVHLLDASMTDVYDTPAGDMAYASGPNDNQTWTATTPITQSQLPPGTYTMTVDAADAGETDQGLATPDPLAFVYSTTLTAGSTAISFAHRTTTITGTLTGVTPGAGGSTMPVGLGGVPVEAVNEETSSSQQIATTAADGTFTGTMTPNPADSYDVRVRASPTMTAAGGRLALTVTRDATRMRSVRVTPAHLRYGQTGKLTGTAQYDNGGTWTALANTTVRVGVGSVQLASVRTSSQGHFSSPMPTRHGPSWNVLVGRGSQFLASTQVSGRLTVAVPLAVRSFTAGLSPFGALSASGCLQVTVAGYGAPGGRIEIQYSRGKHGPWKNLGKLQVGRSASRSCAASRESFFTGSLAVRVPSAYYRAEYPAGIHFQRTVSKALHRFKELTKITSFTVSPLSVPRKGFVTVSGRLWRHGRSWQPFAHRKVLVLFHYKGTWFLYRHEPRTNSSGSFSGRFQVFVSAPWITQYNGDKTHFASASRRVHVSAESGSAAAPLTAIRRVARPAGLAALLGPR